MSCSGLRHRLQWVWVVDLRKEIDDHLKFDLVSHSSVTHRLMRGADVEEVRGVFEFHPLKGSMMPAPKVGKWVNIVD